MVFHPENHTVSYFNRRWWYFKPELSNGSLTDRITQLNAVAIVSRQISFFYSADAPSSNVSLLACLFTVGETQGEILGRSVANYSVADAVGVGRAYHEDGGSAVVQGLRGRADRAG